MGKKAKTGLIIAASLVVIGLVMFAAAMSAGHWDFSCLNTVRMETNTCEIKDEFSRMELNIITADVSLAASEDSTCRVVCFEQENMNHSVEVLDGVLTIRVTDGREWYEHIGVGFQSPEITVYLPGSEYESLFVKGSTGNFEISEKIHFGSVDISLSTGDIRLADISADSLDLNVSTGEICVSDVDCGGDLNVCVTTGDAEFSNVTCRNLSSGGSTGDISLKNVRASEKLFIERSTGDIALDNVDAAEIVTKTDTGDVTERSSEGEQADTAEQAQNLTVTKWFDSLDGDSPEMAGVLETELSEYPGTTIRYHEGSIEKITDHGKTLLFFGDQVLNVYFCDLSGDGKREICASVMSASQYHEQMIIAVDLAADTVHCMSDPGRYDYGLVLRNGQLWAQMREYAKTEVLEFDRLVLRSLDENDESAFLMLMFEHTLTKTDIRKTD